MKKKHFLKTSLVILGGRKYPGRLVTFLVHTKEEVYFSS